MIRLIEKVVYSRDHRLHFLAAFKTYGIHDKKMPDGKILFRSYFVHFVYPNAEMIYPDALLGMLIYLYNFSEHCSNRSVKTGSKYVPLPCKTMLTDV